MAKRLVHAQLPLLTLALSFSAGPVSAQSYGFDDGYPVITADPSQVCSDVTFVDANGELQKGSLACENLGNLKPENIKAGVSIGPVAGSLSEASEIHPPCQSDGEENCLSSASFPAVATAGLAARVVISLRVAGVVGIAAGESHSLCTAAQQTACVTTATYPTMDLSAASAAITDLTSANFNASIASNSNFEFWDSSGTRYQVAGDADLAAAHIVSGKTLFGVAGSAAEMPANCAGNGSQNCLATGAYFAATSCTADSSNCFLPSYQVTTQPLKAISYDAIDAGKNSIRSSLALSGIQGNLQDCAAANGTGCLTTASYKSIDLSAAGTDTGLTSANYTSRIATAANSEFWDASGNRHSVSGDADLSAGNIKSGVVIHGVTGDYPSASYPLANSTATTDLTSFASQLKTDGSFEFFDSAGTRYTGSGDSDLLAANVRSGVSFENLSVTGSYVWTCPSGWIKVPGDSAYGTPDFCAMKYEAKDVGSVATSQASSPPWVSISQATAITTCRALGTGYDLIGNLDWMTIGANIAGRGSNWTSGTVGSGTMIAGHTDDDPSSACPASSNDTLYFVETDCTAVGAGDSGEQRRTYNLSNGEVIWDLSGNVWEWVRLINRGDKPGATNAYYEYSALSGSTTMALKDLVPTNAVKSYWTNSWNSTQLVGNFYPGTNGVAGGMQRGGHWSDNANAGLFTAFLNSDPVTTSGTDLGFRCRYYGP